ncbi:MAG: Site-specific DNA-methyltransferase [Parcubacteria group bacterium GW2011_GWC1_43_61]|nr:MAG: Site-specific DNA-methyltransferase [Candidatus Azambacteria bacterium GW2011_GWF1_41_10]KKS49546.1 MAG: Site-specific DNA-methyltransferase [Candidatus Azambacteria bacterium GW2011_GWF2_42_22]KKS69429.1 MAG: Site-specific DNA-methyltransferase [Candidatus Azambacteria bacterium GW2011_GWA2_42_62]KKS74363.1 MAG: Site-specific DNA-methyltransferase [Candidatus Azambacteria bacterium GW2011_GWB1_42_72]KKT03657.1 MAG: Site-specific DNA-methyltransferase [Candidatus Azambacteria bacterium 
MNYKDLQKIQKESTEQVLPQQKKVLSASDKIRRKTNNLPDPTHPPMGWKDGKGYDHIFPWIHLPRLHPKNHGDTVIFNDSKTPTNQLILGDNLEVLRTLSTESIDLIYIDPPFFSGRNYNVIWGDTNEVRSFYDIWEGGIDSYLVWLNARLWEMRRVLKKTGSIYVHCDWHASHYIKTEMDKIFGYENFRNEIIWCYQGAGQSEKQFKRKHDIILFYTKSKEYDFNYSAVGILTGEKQRVKYTGKDEKGYFKSYKHSDGKVYKKYFDEDEVMPQIDWWMDISIIQSSNERIGYPTQKPEALLERIIKASSNEGDVVADFFCGGGTTLAVAQKLKRRFIGCDSSRVAVSVTLDRLVKIGEEMSGVESDVRKGNKEAKQAKLGMEFEKVPNIEVSYLGVYPSEKFASILQDEFVDFVLTCYGASKNTAQGVAHGFRPPGQSEPILVGPANPKESIGGKEIKAFFDEIKSQLEPNKLVSAKIIGWRFSRQIVQYINILEKYIEKHTLPLKLDLIPLDSKEFRARVLQRYPDANEAEFFLRFSKAPVIGDIKIKKIKKLEYEFEAIDAISTNEDGWLVNCQWDFNYQEGHFVADKDYILSREKVSDKKKGERFKAILKARHVFEKSGEIIVACKVQDNLAGETIFSKKIKI